MANIENITNYLNTLLSPEKYQDYGYNGLQVESQTGSDIEKIATAVDSGLSIIESAVSQKADLLIVHHGLIWGGLNSITGIIAKKIDLLLKSGCSLYASHLPLDGHMEYGNAVLLAKELNLSDFQPAFNHNGNTIGITAINKASFSIDELKKMSSKFLGNTEPLILNFGSSKINSVGIVTGSGTSAILEASKIGVDLFISGEPKQEAYHLAKELKINTMFLGHYCTETFGVRKLGDLLAQKYLIPTVFIDEPTGI